MHRREFLHTTAALGAGVLLPELSLAEPIHVKTISGNKGNIYTGRDLHESSFCWRSSAWYAYYFENLTGELNIKRLSFMRDITPAFLVNTLADSEAASFYFDNYLMLLNKPRLISYGDVITTIYPGELTKYTYITNVKISFECFQNNPLGLN